MTSNITSRIASNKGIAIVLLSILVFAMIIMSSSHGVDVQIDGDDIDGVGGFFGVLFGCGITVVAVVFALGLTGMVLAGVAILLCVIFAVVLGSLALAMLPLLFPVLLVVGLVALFSRRKTA
ncbi:hypothetical protein ACO0LL_04670 [Undibacterium sp. TC4M20W]|uniref:hypothetical protein n=1 Tax=Undibacterium sp. TC4M20W TaxID=3413052 RepID=UPI003BF1219B